MEEASETIEDARARRIASTSACGHEALDQGIGLQLLGHERRPLLGSEQGPIEEDLLGRECLKERGAMDHSLFADEHPPCVALRAHQDKARGEHEG